MQRKIFLCFFLFIFSLFTYSQKTINHRIEHDFYLTRAGFSDNLSYHFTFKRIDFGVGTGFNWQKLISAKFYAPHINANIYYLIINKEKLKIGLGLDYVFDWHIYPTNPTAHTHSLFYGYELIAGKKWCFVHRLGVGGQMRSDFPKGNTIGLNVELSVGVAYVF
jgi:hypothetical protein